MKTILITGSNGQLGESCIKILESYFNIIATSRKESNSALKMDITDSLATKKILKDFKPEVIVNLAAMTDVDGCEVDKGLAKKINVEGVKNLCQYFKGHFIQISTDYVFDGLNGPYSESDKVNPISYYGESKLLAEEWLKINFVKSTILRTNVVYNYIKHTNASFLKWVIDSLNKNKTINVVNDQWNNPTWSQSLSIVIARIIKKESFGLYHYGDKDYMSRFEFAKLIANVFKLDSSLIIPISTLSLDQIAQRPLNGGLKTKKIESELGIIPNTVENCLHEIHKLLDK